MTHHLSTTLRQSRCHHHKNWFFSLSFNRLPWKPDEMWYRCVENLAVDAKICCLINQKVLMSFLSRKRRLESKQDEVARRHIGTESLVGNKSQYFWQFTAFERFRQNGFEINIWIEFLSINYSFVIAYWDHDQRLGWTSPSPVERGSSHDLLWIMITRTFSHWRPIQ